MKTALMDAFTRFGDLEGLARFNEDGSVSLPRISILTATSAANSGVSSNYLSMAMHKGFPFSLYDMVQEMGRVNRTQQMSDCFFQVHASFNCFVSAFVRIMTNSEASERQRLANHLLDVLSLLVIPSRCYHVAIERYFEWDVHTPGTCIDMCSYCCGTTATLTGRFKRRQVEGVLTAAFSTNITVTPDELKKALKRSQNKIFNIVPKTMGPIHALMLQLVANGILKLGVADSNKVGKDKLTTKDVVLKLATAIHEEIPTPAQMVESMWTNMTWD